MKNRITILLLSGLLTAILLTSGCRSHKALSRVDLEDRRVAVVAMIPEPPMIFGDDDWWIDFDRPLASIARVGTGIAKVRQMRKAQARLDSAWQYIDISEVIAERTLAQSARNIGYGVVAHPRDAEFVMDLKIDGHGIIADSWEGRTFFFVDGIIEMLDQQTGKVVWRKRVEERQLITGTAFGLGQIAGNVLSAKALADLDTQEMVAGLEVLAAATADELGHKLYRDYLKSRRDDR